MRIFCTYFELVNIRQVNSGRVDKLRGMDEFCKNPKSQIPNFSNSFKYYSFGIIKVNNKYTKRPGKPAEITDRIT